MSKTNDKSSAACARTIGSAECERLIEDAVILHKDRPRVLRLADGRILKIFRPRRWLSSSGVWPYARRFKRSVDQLQKRGIACPRETVVCRVRSLRRDAVIYDPLEGEELRICLENKVETRDDLLSRFAIFLATLHRQGVYFRSIHLGNVLLCPDGTFGLIDVSRCGFSKHPLSGAKRARNFRPIISHDEDVALLEEFGLARFIEQYLQAAQLSTASRKRFLATLDKRYPLLHEAACSLR